MSGLFVIVAVILSLGTLALLLWPLLRGQRRNVPSRAGFDMRLYRDQLAEVERDAARGLLAPAEAEAARIEVKRRLLAAADAEENATGETGVAESGAAERPAPRRWLPIAALAVLLPTAAGLLYLELGQPGIPDQPLAQRRMQQMLAGGASAEQAASLEEATRQLEQRLASRPEDLGGWFLLGRSYLSLQRLPEAVRALARARALAPDEPDIVGAYAEAALAASGGQIDATVREALTRLLALDRLSPKARFLLALDPLSPKARFLLALDQAQQGDLAAAMQGWVDLVAISPPDAPWLPTVHEHLAHAAAESGIDPATVKPTAEALALATSSGQPAEVPPAPAPGPTAAEVAAARQMSPEDRQQMIRGMVEGLAARLQENPDNIDGWRRLARAWEVLGEPEKAAEARARVAALERR